MTQLVAGEHDVTLNGVQIHYFVRGKGPVLIAHSGGPGGMRVTGMISQR
jgi:proline iminopeptidase